MKILNEEFHRRWRNNRPAASCTDANMPSSSSDISSMLSFSRRNSIAEPPMQIKITNHYNSKVYTSRSPVRGEVVIVPPRDIPFSDVSIILLGITKSRSEVAQMVQEASHTFLKLKMPIPTSSFPSPRVFKAGQTYNIPLNFVIPDHLTLSSCRHKNQSEDVADQHIRPPPSMGSWEKDDMSPVMARVEYFVLAYIEGELYPGEKPSIILESSHRINVLPASIEDPPMNITAQDRGYVLEKTANLRKHLFAGKKGRITASTVQPAPIRVKADGMTSSDIALDIKFRFDASSPSDIPPEVNQVSAKLQSSTWFSRMPIGNLPSNGDTRGAAITGITHLNYSTSVTLDTPEFRKSQWQGQRGCLGSMADLHAEEAGRRQSDSAVGLSQREADESARRRSEASLPASLKSSLKLSLKFPSSKRILLPTFHTCLISRTYTIQLSLIMGDAKINLVVPVQVVVESPPELLQEDTGLPTFEDVLAAQEEADADELLRPRVISPPDEELQGNSVLPGYDRV